MTISVRLLEPDEAAVLDRVAPDVFDNDVVDEHRAEFLADPRHHIAVAIDDDIVVGIASALHYLHPDKPNDFFINEVGVAPSHQRRGIGKRLLETLLDHARSLNCNEAWVATEEENTIAQKLYASLGATGERAVFYTYKL